MSIRTCPFTVIVIPVVFVASVRAAEVKEAQRPQGATIEVTVKTRTGGQVTGVVVDHNEHGLVVLSGQLPFVFAYRELEPGSAFVTKRDLLALERGGTDRLTADDHFALGAFALRMDRNDLAALEFRKAGGLDASFKPRARQAFAEFRERNRAAGAEGPSFMGPAGGDRGEEGDLPDDAPGDATDRLIATLSRPAADSDAYDRARVMSVYRTFGEEVREVIGRDLAMVETDHFLIWTDWAPKDRDRLAEACEGMYAALCRQFGRDPASPIFIAKCPVFCFRSKPRFQKFAQYFDGYGGKNAVGYTRSIEANGHVHVALLRQGSEEADFDRFACTLVHEGSHAFVHRLDGPRLIPHWVNEGLAELMTDRVLGDRCPSARNAELLARWYVGNARPVEDLLRSLDAIGVEQYPLAHSLVAYLEAMGADRFTAFVGSLKKGAETELALAEHYGGLTLGDLERRWRESIRSVALDDQRTMRRDGGPQAADAARIRR